MQHISQVWQFKINQNSNLNAHKRFDVQFFGISFWIPSIYFNSKWDFFQ